MALRCRVSMLISVSLILGLATSHGAESYLFGTLKSAPERAVAMKEAGISVVTMSIRWERFEPRPKEKDPAYIAFIHREISQYHSAGLQIIADLGMHYPPRWAQALPGAKFVDQYGDAWNPAENGKMAVNAVFSQRLREQIDWYVDQVFREFGSDLFACRLGWSCYGEIHYPFSSYLDRKNCYWAFDDLAQGRVAGLPPHLRPCPVPGWKPGQASANHASADIFIQWYLDCLADFHDWQIALVRRHFSGPLVMMYASWGIRPGDIETAVAHDLDGSSPAERPSPVGPDGGQIARGYDFARFVARIRDPKVFVYSTTLAADDSGDGTDLPHRWSPIHYLSYLASANPVQPSLYGENAGNGSLGALERSIRQMRKYGLVGMSWAFEDQLLASPEHGWATLADYARGIKAVRGN